MHQMLQVILMCQWRQKLYCKQQQLAAQPQQKPKVHVLQKHWLYTQGTQWCAHLTLK